jgi:hypothetical protein
LDDFPVAGHATIHTTSAQAGEPVRIWGNEYVLSDAMHSLPWEFVGYYFVAGAKPRPMPQERDEARRALLAVGHYLLTVLYHHQSTYTLEQLESLKMLVAAPEYTLRALATVLPAAAALDLADAALDDCNTPEEISSLAAFIMLVEELDQERGVLYAVTAS